MNNDLLDILNQLAEEGHEVTPELITQVMKQYQAKTNPQPAGQEKPESRGRIEDWITERESTTKRRTQQPDRAEDKDLLFEKLRTAGRNLANDDNRLRNAFGELLE